MKQSPFTLAITSLKPHAGRTTTALALAWALGRAGRRVLVLDANQYPVLLPGKTVGGDGVLWDNVVIGNPKDGKSQSNDVDLVIMDAPPLTGKHAEILLQSADAILVSVVPIAQNRRFLPGAKSVLSGLDPTRVVGWFLTKISDDNSFHQELAATLKSHLTEWNQLLSVPEQTGISGWNPLAKEDLPAGPLHDAYLQLTEVLTPILPEPVAPGDRPEPPQAAIPLPEPAAPEVKADPPAPGPEPITLDLQEPPAAPPTPPGPVTPPPPPVEAIAAPAPPVEPKATPAPPVEPKATPAPPIEPKATPAPPVEPKATPAPPVEPKATPAPPAEPKATSAPPAEPAAALPTRPVTRSATDWRLIGTTTPGVAVSLLPLECGLELPQGMQAFPHPVPASAMRALLRFGLTHGFSEGVDPDDPATMRLRPSKEPTLATGSKGPLHAACKALLAGDEAKAVKALAKVKGSGDALYLAGLLHLAADRPVDAVRDLTAALENGSQLGTDLAQDGLAVLADAAFAHGVTTHFGTNVRGAHFALALAHYSLGDEESLLAELDQLVELESDDLVLRALRIERVLDRGSLTDLEELHKAQLVPSYDTPVHMLLAFYRAQTLHRLGLPDTASLALREIHGLVPEAWTSLRHAVDVECQAAVETLARIQRVRNDLAGLTTPTG